VKIIRGINLKKRNLNLFIYNNMTITERIEIGLLAIVAVGIGVAGVHLLILTLQFVYSLI